MEDRNSYVGRRVRKQFINPDTDKGEYFEGQVERCDGPDLFLIVYEDGR